MDIAFPRQRSLRDQEDHPSRTKCHRKDRHRRSQKQPRNTVVDGNALTAKQATSCAACRTAAARDFLAARAHGIRAVNVRGDQSRGYGHLVIPARVFQRAGRFPGPEYLIRMLVSEAERIEKGSTGPAKRKRGEERDKRTQPCAVFS